MFGIDGPEFVIILLVLIVVIGPKDLPKMLRAFGKATARMRTTANEFRRQFDDAMREAELDDLQKTMSDVTDLDPRKKLTKIFDPIRDVAKDVRASIEVKPIEGYDESLHDAATPEKSTIVETAKMTGAGDVDLPSVIPLSDVAEPLQVKAIVKSPVKKAATKKKDAAKVSSKALKAGKPATAKKAPSAHKVRGATKKQATTKK